MNFGKQILVSFVLVYLISLSFACETSFLGFELDLLTHEFLVNSICWRSTLRNPWYSYFSSIYFSYSDFCSFLSGCSYPETPDISPDTPDHKTRSIQALTRSIRASLCLTFLLSVLNCRLPIHPPLGIFRSFQHRYHGKKSGRLLSTLFIQAFSFMQFIHVVDLEIIT